MSGRFFVLPEAMAGEQVTFNAAQAHQLCRVLRLRPGDRMTVLDNSGLEYEVELVAVRHDGATGRVVAKRSVQTEPRLSLTLYPCLLKGDRLEWVLQKGTELGVSAFVPLFSSRTVIRGRESVAAKRPRWQEIIREAAEQSHRGRLPSLAVPLSFAEACAQCARTHTLSLIPWEKEESVALVEALQVRPASVGLFIGPEGGFDPSEIALARSHGIRPVTLGPRILRAETAAIAAVAVVMAGPGEW